jgi:hypothetical protein
MKWQENYVFLPSTSILSPIKVFCQCPSITVHVTSGISNCLITHRISSNIAPTYSSNMKGWGGNRLKTDMTEYLACSQLNVVVCDRQNIKYGRQNWKTVITTLYRTVSSNYMVSPLTVKVIYEPEPIIPVAMRVFLHFINVACSNKMNKWATADLIPIHKFKCIHTHTKYSLVC